MEQLKWFEYPYQYLLQGWVTALIPAIMALSAIGIILDWTLPAENRRKGRFSMLLVIVNLLLYQNQYLTNRSAMDIWLVATAAFLLLIYGIIFRSHIRRDWIRDSLPSPYWAGLVLIAVITVVKFTDVATWPPFLKSYAAMTGRWGMKAIEGQWPTHLFQGRGFDLRGGGESPLMLPIMYLVMKILGVSLIAVRTSEIVGSTILLVLFWSWLRTTLPGSWALVALTVFGLSPWHLAQSRMGTFFSISAAIAMGILWTAQNAWRSQRYQSATFWWMVCGGFAGCIGWCYAPMKVMYACFFVLLLGTPLLRKFSQKRWYIPILGALLCFGALFGLQLKSVQNPASMFKSHFGPLATDNPVWRKTVDDKVEAGVQPTGVIAANLKRNFLEWMPKTFRERGILPMYGSALVLSFVIALLCLINNWNPILGVYYLFGLLPPLIVFPLHRRTLIIWPLVYVAAVVVLREISVSGSDMFKNIRWKRVVPVMVGVCICCMVIQGLSIWVNTWSIVYDHTYFGPPWRLRAIARAAELMPTHRVVFLNPWVHRDTIEITLYEQNKTLGGNKLLFSGVNKRGSQLRTFVSSNEPTAFFYFELSNQDWLKETIQQTLPGGRLEEVRNPSGRKELLYSVYTVYQ